MPLYGKQHRFCPNCGKPLYDAALSNTNVLSQMCSAQCRAEWQAKFSRFILGKDADPEGEK